MTSLSKCPDFAALRAKRWLILGEASLFLGCSINSVRNFIHSGEIPAALYGKGYVVDVSDLDMFIARRKKKIRPYRKNSRPWVAERHARARKAASK